MIMDLRDLNTISEKIIGCAIEVHKVLGPGLLESVYHKALMHEFRENKIKFESEKEIQVMYKGHIVGEFRADFIIEKSIVLEIKSVDRNDPVFEAQLLSYMKAGSYSLGLLLNFNNRLLKRGIKRLVL